MDSPGIILKVLEYSGACQNILALLLGSAVLYSMDVFRIFWMFLEPSPGTLGTLGTLHWGKLVGDWGNLAKLRGSIF